MGEVRPLDAIIEDIPREVQEKIWTFLDASSSWKEDCVFFLQNLEEVVPFSETFYDVVISSLPLVGFIPLRKMFWSTSLDIEPAAVEAALRKGTSLSDVIQIDFEGVYLFKNKKGKCAYIVENLIYPNGGFATYRIFIFNKKDFKNFGKELDKYFQRIHKPKKNSQGYVSIPILRGSRKSQVKINPAEFEGDNFYTGHFDFTGILRDTLEFLDQDDEEEYLKKGIPKKRGIIFYGSPGVGKSKVLRYLVYNGWKLNIGSSWLSSSGILKGGMKFSDIFQSVSSTYKKKLVIIEDADPLFKQVSDSLLDSELLQIFDGLDQGILHQTVVVISVNAIDVIPIPFRRPGRFDRVFVFPKLSKEDAERILGFPVPFSNLTMAEIRELRMLAEKFGPERGIEEFKVIRKYYHSGSRFGFGG